SSADSSDQTATIWNSAAGWRDISRKSIPTIGRGFAPDASILDRYRERCSGVAGRDARKKSFVGPILTRGRQSMSEIAVEAPQTPAQLPQIRVAVLGAGKMGGILLQAFLKENLFATDKIRATVGHAERALALSTQWGVDVSTNNLEAVKQSDLILVGVKPFQVPELIAEIRPALTP